jgi:hypothetical protein
MGQSKKGVMLDTNYPVPKRKQRVRSEWSLVVKQTFFQL